jgi:hypothetical protein
MVSSVGFGHVIETALSEGHTTVDYPLPLLQLMIEADPSSEDLWDFL